MAKEFELRLEVELPAAPETVWAAITTPQTEGWLWRIDYEPRLGGAERGLTSGGGAVTAWEPDRRFATRAEKPGWFNQLEYELEPRGDATGLRFRHTTEFEDDSSPASPPRASRTRTSTTTRSASTCATSPAGPSRT